MERYEVGRRTVNETGRGHDMRWDIRYNVDDSLGTHQAISTEHRRGTTPMTWPCSVSNAEPLRVTSFPGKRPESMKTKE